MLKIQFIDGSHTTAKGDIEDVRIAFQSVAASSHPDRSFILFEGKTDKGMLIRADQIITVEEVE